MAHLRMIAYYAPLLILFVAPTATAAAPTLPVPETIEFNRDVRPILSENCYACHGPDKNKREAELRLDIEEGLLGADTVFRDGSLCNKIGTRLLADAAAARSVPVVVAAEALKLAPVDAADAPALDSEAATLFDLTPGTLVDLVATEEGCVRSDDVRPLVDRTPFLRDGWALLEPVS